jgi:hypothetical protein
VILAQVGPSATLYNHKVMILYLKRPALALLNYSDINFASFFIDTLFVAG